MRLATKMAAIELRDGEVRVALVRTGGKLPVLLDYIALRVACPEGFDPRAALVETLRAAMERLNAKPNAYVLCADSRYAVCRTLRVPFKGKGRVAASVRFELEPYLAFPIEDLIVAQQIIREVDGETEVLVVGMRKSHLIEQLDILNEAGVDPDGIGADMIGMASLVFMGGKPSKDLRAYLHLRDDGAALAISRGGSLAYLRPLDLNASELQDHPLLAAREAANSLRSFSANWKGEEELTGLTVTGVSPESFEASAFQESFNIPVTITERLLPVISTPRARKGAHGEPDTAAVYEDITAGTVTRPNYWTPLAGVAAGAAGGVVFLNFRQGELAQPRAYQGVLAHAAFTACIGVMAAACFGAYAYMDYRSNKAGIERAGNEIWELYSQSFPASESVKSGRLKQDTGGMISLSTMEKDFEAYTNSKSGLDASLLLRPTLADILKDLSERLSASKVLVTDMTIRRNKEKSQIITVKGEVKDTAAFALEYEKLKQSALLKFQPEPVVSSRNGVTTFTITAST